MNNRRSPLMMLATMALAMGATADQMPSAPPVPEPSPTDGVPPTYSPYVASKKKPLNYTKEETRRVRQMEKLAAKRAKKASHES